MFVHGVVNMGCPKKAQSSELFCPPRESAVYVAIRTFPTLLIGHVPSNFDPFKPPIQHYCQMLKKNIITRIIFSMQYIHIHITASLATRRESQQYVIGYSLSAHLIPLRHLKGFYVIDRQHSGNITIQIRQHFLTALLVRFPVVSEPSRRLEIPVH